MVDGCRADLSRGQGWRNHRSGFHIPIRHGRTRRLHIGALLRYSAHGSVEKADGPQSSVSSFSAVTDYPTLALTTSSGAIQLIRHTSPAWIREEGLADLAAVRFVDLAEKEVEEVRYLAEEGFVQRTIRHLTELKVNRIFRSPIGL